MKPTLEEFEPRLLPDAGFTVTPTQFVQYLQGFPGLALRLDLSATILSNQASLAPTAFLLAAPAMSPQEVDQFFTSLPTLLGDLASLEATMVQLQQVAQTLTALP